MAVQEAFKFDWAISNVPCVTSFSNLKNGLGGVGGSFAVTPTKQSVSISKHIWVRVISCFSFIVIVSIAPRRRQLGCGCWTCSRSVAAGTSRQHCGYDSTRLSRDSRKY
jgi:hypothetical protein